MSVSRQIIRQVIVGLLNQLMEGRFTVVEELAGNLGSSAVSAEAVPQVPLDSRRTKDPSTSSITNSRAEQNNRTIEHHHASEQIGQPMNNDSASSTEDLGRVTQPSVGLPEASDDAPMVFIGTECGSE